jgi:hypothetical protein
MNSNKTTQTLKSTAITLLLISTLLISCKKDSEAPKTEPTYPITGVWIGTYTQDQATAQSNYSYAYSIFPDGTILTKGGANDGLTHYASGTWTLTSDSLFSATIMTINVYETPITQNISAIFSSKGTLTNGVWANAVPINGTTFSGKFSLQRVN